MNCLDHCLTYIIILRNLELTSIDVNGSERVKLVLNYIHPHFYNRVPGVLGIKTKENSQGDNECVELKKKGGGVRILKCK